MFEQKTYQYLLAQALARAPANVDTRQGSIFRDSVSGQMLILASMYVDLDNFIKLLSLDSAEGEYLDDKSELLGIERNAATLATYEATLTGTATVEDGARFFAEGLFFGLYHDDNGDAYFECETPGAAGNYIEAGTEANPIQSIDGLTSAIFGERITAAADEETDDSLRSRIKARIYENAENGNAAHYKKWCEEVEGVGSAKIIPLWKGPNTVKGIIFAEDGSAASAEVVAAVQAHVDPDDDEDGEGDGLGEGAANLGAKFTAVAPTALPINVSAQLSLADGADLTAVTERISQNLSSYLLSLAQSATSDTLVRYYQISTIIMSDDDVIDHTGLTVNSGTANVPVAYDKVCTLGTVTLTDAQEA